MEVDHSRNYFEINGCLFPKDENLSNAKFLENMDNSARQSRDAFWGYALSNSWDYFITLTTNRMKVDRYDDEQVKRCGDFVGSEYSVLIVMQKFSLFQNGMR